MHSMGPVSTVYVLELYRKSKRRRNFQKNWEIRANSRYLISVRSWQRALHSWRVSFSSFGISFHFICVSLSTICQLYQEYGPCNNKNMGHKGSAFDNEWKLRHLFVVGIFAYFLGEIILIFRSNHWKIYRTWRLSCLQIFFTQYHKLRKQLTGRLSCLDILTTKDHRFMEINLLEDF